MLLALVTIIGCEPSDPDGGDHGAAYIIHVTDQEFVKDGPSYNWFSDSGSGRQYYWAVTSAGVPYNSARWTVPFSQPGRYVVRAAISSENGLTSTAPYTIRANGKSVTIAINQSQNQGLWIPLGTFYFSADGTEYVELHNNTGRNGYKIVFDSMMWEDVDSGE